MQAMLFSGPVEEIHAEMTGLLHGEGIWHEAKDTDLSASRPGAYLATLSLQIGEGFDSTTLLITIENWRRSKYRLECHGERRGGMPSTITIKRHEHRETFAGAKQEAFAFYEQAKRLLGL